MASRTFVIFPDQLFATEHAIEIIGKCQEVYLMEEPYYFDNRSRDSIVHARARMTEYMELLSKHVDCSIKYISISKIKLKGKTAFDFLIGVSSVIEMFRLTDVYAFGDTPWEYSYMGLPIQFHESPGWLSTYRSIRDKSREGARYNQKSKEMHILKGMNLPDALMNAPIISREPRDTIFKLTFSIDNPAFNRAIDYANRKFEVATPIERKEINHEEAASVLEYFITTLLPSYRRDDISYILDSLRCGLLTPREVLIGAVKAWYENKNNAEYTSSVRTFISDLIALEYSRLLYIANPEITKNNIYNHTNAVVVNFDKITNENIKRLNAASRHMYSSVELLIKYLTVVETADPCKINEWCARNVSWWSTCVGAYMIPGFISHVRSPSIQFKESDIPDSPEWQNKLTEFKQNTAKPKKTPIDTPSSTAIITPTETK